MIAGIALDLRNSPWFHFSVNQQIGFGDRDSFPEAVVLRRYKSPSTCSYFDLADLEWTAKFCSYTQTQNEMKYSKSIVFYHFFNFLTTNPVEIKLVWFC